MECAGEERENESGGREGSRGDVGWRGTTAGADGITFFPTPLTKDRIYSHLDAYIHIHALVKRAWTSAFVRTHPRTSAVYIDERVYVCNTCSHPSGSDGVRACQTDDEKELVHSRYPCELEGTRVGRVEGGRTRARIERKDG